MSYFQSVNALGLQAACGHFQPWWDLRLELFWSFKRLVRSITTSYSSPIWSISPYFALRFCIYLYFDVLLSSPIYFSTLLCSPALYPEIHSDFTLISLCSLFYSSICSPLLFLTLLLPLLYIFYFSSLIFTLHYTLRVVTQSQIQFKTDSETQTREGNFFQLLNVSLQWCKCISIWQYWSILVKCKKNRVHIKKYPLKAIQKLHK